VDISSSAPNGFDRTSQGSGFDELYIGEGVIGSIYSIQWGATWLVRNDSGTADPTDFVDVVGDLDIPLDEGVWVLW
jgi:hypothetical protein